MAGGTLVSRRRAYLLLRRLRRSRARCLSPNPSVAAECPSRHHCFLSCCPCAAAEPLLLVPRFQPVAAALHCPCSAPLSFTPPCATATPQPTDTVPYSLLLSCPLSSTPIFRPRPSPPAFTIPSRAPPHAPAECPAHPHPTPPGLFPCVQWSRPAHHAPGLPARPTRGPRDHESYPIRLAWLIPVLPLVPSGSSCTRPDSPAHPRPTLP